MNNEFNNCTGSGQRIFDSLETRQTSQVFLRNVIKGTRKRPLLPQLNDDTVLQKDE